MDYAIYGDRTLTALRMTLTAHQHLATPPSVRVHRQPLRLPSRRDSHEEPLRIIPIADHLPAPRARHPRQPIAHVPCKCPRRPAAAPRASPGSVGQWAAKQVSVCIVVQGGAIQRTISLLNHCIYRHIFLPVGSIICD